MNPTTFLPMLTRVLDEVNQISLPGPGFTRPSYSNEESRAHECIAGICEALGLKIRYDAAYASAVTGKRLARTSS